MATCRYCGDAGGRHVSREENCSKCRGFGRVADLGKDIYCSRCFGRGTITASVWQTCSCQQRGREGNQKSNQKSGQTGGPTSSQKHGCFPEGTMVMTPLGQVEISTLKAGDKVSVYDPEKAAILERRVLRVLRYRQRPSLRLTFADGARLHVTCNHNILVEGQWLRASAVKKGMILSTLGKGIPDSFICNTEVVQIEDGGICDVVYNPVVEDAFSLIANGVITHNFDRFKRAKIIYWGFRTYFMGRKEGSGHINNTAVLIKSHHG